MLEHRHIYPRSRPDEISGWHDASIEHKKYPHAHYVILETREKGDSVVKRERKPKENTGSSGSKYKLERTN